MDVLVGREVSEADKVSVGETVGVTVAVMVT
jgi:hypothetical protein